MEVLLRSWSSWLPSTDCTSISGNISNLIECGHPNMCRSSKLKQYYVSTRWTTYCITDGKLHVAGSVWALAREGLGASKFSEYSVNVYCDILLQNSLRFGSHHCCAQCAHAYFRLHLANLTLSTYSHQDWLYKKNRLLRYALTQVSLHFSSS